MAKFIHHDFSQIKEKPPEGQACSKTAGYSLFDAFTQEIAPFLELPYIVPSLQTCCAAQFFKNQVLKPKHDLVTDPLVYH